MLSVGLGYAWSIFSVPLKESFGWSASTLSFTFTILMWSFCLGGILGVRLTKRVGARVAQRIAALLISAGFLTVLLATESTPWVLYLSYGVMCGMGIGIVYNTTIGTLARWFSDRIGFMSGVLLACYGCSTLVLGSLAAWLFILIGWRMTFVAFAIFLAVVLLLCSFAIKPPTSAQYSELAAATAEGRSAADSSRDSVSDAVTPKRNSTTKEMLRHPAFYFFFAWVMFLNSIGFGTISHAKQVGLDVGLEAAAATLFVGLLMTCSGFGRLFIGALFDAVGRKKTMIGVTIVMMLACLCFIYAIPKDTTVSALVACVCMGVGMSGIITTSSAFVADFFGSEHYASNFAVINLAILPGSFIGPLVMSLSITNAGSYQPAMMVFFGFTVVAFLCKLAVDRFK